MYRAHNFSAGPAALPLEVLEKAREEFLDFAGSGSSVIELSHRGPEYIEVDRQATERLRTLLGIGDEFEIMFLQGGASTQFMMVPYNFLDKNNVADYIVTGAWSKKAIKEAAFFGNAHTAFTSEAENFTRVPANADLKPSGKAVYTHFTSNNTIFGTQFREEPDSAGSQLVCDASSDFLSRPLDMKRYGLIYAGAQKNAGPAGVTIVIIHKDFLEKQVQSPIPTILNYKTHIGTMFNTPPVFGVYMANLVFGWIIEKGGLSTMEKLNREKAALLYDEIDRDGFYRGTAEKASRSHMNVTFVLGNPELEKAFLKEAEDANLKGLKGHRSVGGFRASIYNACSLESVEALVSFMSDFRMRMG